MPARTSVLANIVGNRTEVLPLDRSALINLLSVNFLKSDRFEELYHRVPRGHLQMDKRDICINLTLRFSLNSSPNSYSE